MIAAWPVPVEELVIIGHSMGGLVARSACVYGERAGHGWRRRLRKLIFLGTPHHGSPWERIGAWTSGVATSMRYTAPFYRFSRTRSAGITDLRYGYLLEEEWMGRDQHAHGPDDRHGVPLPAGVECYAIAVSLGARPGDKKDVLLGDGLVPVSSALGMHADAERRLVFAAERQWVGYGIGHLDLLSRPEVYDRIEAWCR